MTLWRADRTSAEALDVMSGAIEAAGDLDRSGSLGFAGLLRGVGKLVAAESVRPSVEKHRKGVADV